MEAFLVSLRAVVAFTLLTGFAYPLVVLVAGKVAFSTQAEGSRVERKGKLYGSELLGQTWEGDQYFASRPSATGPNPYNGAASSGSNYGPLNPDYLKAVKERQAALGANAPVDLLTSSGSGLDPHISPEGAEIQVEKVARARGMTPEAVRARVAQFTEGRQWGVLGEPRVNVLKLNLSLDGVL